MVIITSLSRGAPCGCAIASGLGLALLQMSLYPHPLQLHVVSVCCSARHCAQPGWADRLYYSDKLSTAIEVTIKMGLRSFTHCTGTSSRMPAAPMLSALRYDTGAPHPKPGSDPCPRVTVSLCAGSGPVRVLTRRHPTDRRRPEDPRPPPAPSSIPGTGATGPSWNPPPSQFGTAPTLGPTSLGMELTALVMALAFHGQPTCCRQSGALREGAGPELEAVRAKTATVKIVLGSQQAGPPCASTVLYCTVLYCTVLYGTVHYCTVLLCCAVMHWTGLFCASGLEDAPPGVLAST